MPDLKLDHLFIITAPGAAVADNLKDLGWVEGPSNTHPGQGTANRRFFFNGFTLELLFVSDAFDAANGAGKKLGILQRSINPVASPFGLVARVIGKQAKPTFPNWRYYPDYFDGGLCFHVGENSNVLQEPMCICMPPSLPEPKPPPVGYANGSWQLTKLIVSVPMPKKSKTLGYFALMDKVQLESRNSHAVNLQFNERCKGESINLEEIPLSISW